MSKLAWILPLVALSLIALAASPAAAQNAVPDLRGKWAGESESVVLGGGNPHHPPTQSAEPRFSSVKFTMTIDRQEGRRFAGIFASATSTETVIGILARNGTIHMVDDDGYDSGTMLAANRMELCYRHLSAQARIVSCTELTKQP
jgi:hypothetical protein